MKKILYPIIAFVLFCLAHLSPGKRIESRRIEEQGEENLVLKPFQLFGLLGSCSPDNESIKPMTSELSHYSEVLDSLSETSTHSSHYSATHFSHNSSSPYTHNSHSSHYSSVHSSHYSSIHSSHYSGSHSSHYSGSHRSHQSHRSHYSSR